MEIYVPRTRADHRTCLCGLKLKDKNIKLAKNFKTSTPGKGKGKGKGNGKGKGQKQTGNQYQYGKGKYEWNKQYTKDG